MSDVPADTRGIGGMGWCGVAACGRQHCASALCRIQYCTVEQRTGDKRRRTDHRRLHSSGVVRTIPSQPRQAHDVQSRIRLWDLSPLLIESLPTYCVQVGTSSNRCRVWRDFAHRGAKSRHCRDTVPTVPRAGSEPCITLPGERRQRRESVPPHHSATLRLTLYAP